MATPANLPTPAQVVYRNTYHDFLARRIPVLQALGKPAVPEGKEPDLATSMQTAKVRIEASRYPGVDARRRADVEWGWLRAHVEETGVTYEQAELDLAGRLAAA